MNLADAQSTEAAQAQDLLAQALRQMQAQRWDEAMQLLESAIPIAPAELRAPAVEILTSIYVSRNEYARLGDLMLRADPSTPQMIKGALLLARNHALGVDGELPAHCDENSLGRALRTHVATGAYQSAELPVIVALLAQLGWAELAARIAMLCAAAGIGIEAGVLERVLAALLAAGRRGEALELVQVLQSLPESEERPVRRWMRLLGAVPREAAAGAGPSQDKVERFLQCAQLVRAA